MVYPGSEFIIKNIEMIKGIYHPVHKRMYRYDEELVVPIIENTCFEKDLKDTMLAAMKKYPASNAVIVRRHGMYVWGDTWEQCKTMAEVYHYLCEIALEMEKLGRNPYTHQGYVSQPITPDVSLPAIKNEVVNSPKPAIASPKKTPPAPAAAAATPAPSTSTGQVKKAPVAKKNTTPAKKGANSKTNGVRNGRVTKRQSGQQQNNANRRSGNAGMQSPQGGGRQWNGPMPPPGMMMGPPMMGMMPMGPGGPMGPMGPMGPRPMGPGHMGRGGMRQKRGRGAMSGGGNRKQDQQHRQGTPQQGNKKPATRGKKKIAQAVLMNY
jgi:hypothetical protein